MKYRTLGRTGLVVSEVGFGGGGIGYVWGPTTDAEAIRSVHRAMELGVNFYDVAPGYGNGKAEELLGQAVQGRRGEILITTKVSIPAQELGDIRGYTLRSVDESLRRLRTDYLDILLVHNSITSRRGAVIRNAITSADALAMADAFKELQRAGKVRYIGFTAWRCNRNELTKLIESGVFDILQTEYNILNQSAQTAPPPSVDRVDVATFEAQGQELPDYFLVDQCQTIPLAKAHNMGVIGIRPLLAGFLTEGLDRPLDPAPHVERMLRRVQSLEFLKQKSRRTLSQAAFIFCLMNPDIATIIPGVKNTSEIEEAAACSGARPLSKADLARIAELYQRDFGA